MQHKLSFNNPSHIPFFFDNHPLDTLFQIDKVPVTFMPHTENFSSVPALKETFQCRNK